LTSRDPWFILATAFSNLLEYDRSGLRGLVTGDPQLYVLFIGTIHFHFTSSFLPLYSTHIYSFIWVETPLSRSILPTESKSSLYYISCVLILIPNITVDTYIYVRFVITLSRSILPTENTSSGKRGLVLEQPGLL
jgi:hypothetical protein